jgi:hypothetical protein
MLYVFVKKKYALCVLKYDFVCNSWVDCLKFVCIQVCFMCIQL